MMNMKESIKRMVLTGAAVTVMMSLAAPAVMAQPVVRDHRDGSGGEAAPIVRDHRDDSTSSTVEPAEEEPYKDPGIRLCDITPVECEEGAQEQKEEEEKPYKDPGIRQCDLTPVECEDAEDHEEQDEPYEEDPDDTGQCFIKPYCQAPEESGDSAGVVRDHRDGGAGGSKDEEAGSAPGGVKVGVNNPSSASAPKEEAISGTPADEAGQTTDSGTIIGGCPFGYDYIEEHDACFPPAESLNFLPILGGQQPWPDSAGGYIGMPLYVAGDTLEVLGAAVQIGTDYVEDALVWYGEDFGVAGWPFLGIGYTVGFVGDLAGTIVSGAGEIVNGVGNAVEAVGDGVGEVVDAIGDAAGDAYDEIASWF